MRERDRDRDRDRQTDRQTKRWCAGFGGKAETDRQTETGRDRHADKADIHRV